MLKNNELNQIARAITMLSVLKEYALSTDTFYKDTGITILDIDKQIKDLQDIHTTAVTQKKRQSNKTNEWNKAHPEAHRKHSRESNRRQRKKLPCWHKDYNYFEEVLKDLDNIAKS